MAISKPRGVLIAGNWKMNHGPKATADFFQKLPKMPRETGAFANGKLQACLIPPAVSLHTALEESKSAPYPIAIAAQNAHWEKSGAFTGELSGPMLNEIGISWVLVGHSERRQHFGETDETVRKRTESLLAQGFRVILCIGETRVERERNQTREVLDRQLAAVFPEPAKGASVYLDGRLVIAYEPVWAIGTGLTASPAQAEEAHQMVRKFLWDRFGMESSGRTPILYGGSVNAENVDSLLACPNVDGALVGGASVKPESFHALIEAGARAVGSN